MNKKFNIFDRNTYENKQIFNEVFITEERAKEFLWKCYPKDSFIFNELIKHNLISFFTASKIVQYILDDTFTSVKDAIYNIGAAHEGFKYEEDMRELIWSYLDNNQDDFVKYAMQNSKGKMNPTILKERYDENLERLKNEK